MVLDLNSNNNLPLSSTSSCTDYFFDGCHSKSQNNCQTQYRNCQCRPCCVNSMINDHTYSLLKKICRKVIKDYHRQQSREKYTIFDGGNSINVRIHRSSFVPPHIGKCSSVIGDPSFSRREDGIVVDRRKIGSISDRSAKDRSKKKGSYDEDGENAGAKPTGGRGQSRKIYPNNHETTSERRSKKKKSRGSKDNDADGVNGTRRKELIGKDKGDNDQDYNEKRGKSRKIKAKRDDDEKDASGNRENGSKRKNKKDGDDISGKEKRDKNKRRTGRSHIADDEDNDIKASREGGIGQSQKSNDRREDKTEKTKSVSKKKGGGADNDRINDDSLNANLDKKHRGQESVDNNNRKSVKGKADKSKSTQNNEDRESETRTGAKRGNNKVGDSFDDRGSEVSAKDKAGNKDNSREGDTLSSPTKGYRADLSSRKRKDGHDDEGKGSKGFSHKVDRLAQGRGSRSADHKSDRARDNQIDDRKSTYLKNKRTSGLPVVLDLRAKVRKGHDVMPIRKSRTGKDSHRSRSFQSERRNTRGRHGATIQIRKRELKQLSKSSKDRINARYGSKGSRRKSHSSRRLGGRLGFYRGYAAWMPSRCDEIKPCDILRAHMEQRELCERQRCCLPCPVDCSAIYCQAPSALCSCLH